MDTGTILVIVNISIPVIVVLLIFLFLKRSLRKQKKSANERRQKISAARPANAKVLSASQGVVGGSIKRLIFLRLEINDGFGQNYEAEAAWFVDTLHFDKIREGSFFPVKVDSQNKYIIYPGESWAVYTEGYGKELSVDSLEKNYS
jgi:preprotein translocase subunit YajC